MKPAARHDVAQPRLAGLRAEREPDLLRQRGGRAEQRRGRVEDAADRVEVVLDAVAGERLDDHPRAVGGERLAHVPGRADRIAHVVQAVEGRDEVVARRREAGGRRDLEAHAVGDARRRGALARPLDRRRVVVEADEGRARERLRHEDGRRAVPAADVGDAARRARSFASTPSSAGIHAGTRLRGVAGAEEALGALEHAVVVLVPADARRRCGTPRRSSARRATLAVASWKAPRHEVRAVLVGQRDGVLGRQRVAPLAGSYST